MPDNVLDALEKVGGVGVGLGGWVGAQGAQ